MTGVAVPDVPLGGIALTDILPCSECGNFLLGRVELFGVLFHVDLIRVVRDEFGFQDVPEDSDDVVHEVWDAMQTYTEDAAFQTVAVPGLDGEFLMFIYPFG